MEEKKILGFRYVIDKDLIPSDPVGEIGDFAMYKDVLVPATAPESSEPQTE